MDTVTATQLKRESKRILDQLEQGRPMIITRNGRAVARLEPLGHAEPPKWDEIMGEVWAAQEKIRASDRVANPVLEERQRRRRFSTAS